MRTIKKVRKAQYGDDFGPVSFGGICGKKAACSARKEARKEARAERKASGETLGQRILKGVGLATQEGIERRQANRADRQANRQFRREERRANRGGGGDAMGVWKNGGKITKKTNMKKAQGGKTLKAEFKMGPNPKLGMRKLEMDTSGYAAGAKRFPVTETTPGVGGKSITRNFATNRKGAASMIEKTQGKSKSVNLPIRRASSVKKQKSGGKTSKRK